VNPDTTTTLKVETYRETVLERAFLIAKLLLSRKKTGAIRLNVSQGSLCNVQWEEKEK
jgi:hypothetical protein